MDMGFEAILGIASQIASSITQALSGNNNQSDGCQQPCAQDKDNFLKQLEKLLHHEDKQWGK
jgi:hypothetical protein